MARFGNRYYPSGTKLNAERIEIEMLLPSGQPGIRYAGQRVILIINPDLAVEVREAVFGTRVLIAGRWDCVNSVCWEPQPEEELCTTAIAMITARVEATTKLFRRGWIGRDWLSPSAKAQVS